MAQPSSKQQPASATPPAGFDMLKAKALAPQVNADLVSGGIQHYSHQLLKKFQLVAGITQDGIYGGGSRGALIFYGIQNPPKPFFKPTATQPYPWTPAIHAQLQAAKPQASKPQAAKPASKPPASKPASKPPTSKPSAPVAATTLASGAPPAGFDILAARALAPKVAADLLKGIGKYSHALLAQFQRLAGIAQDGLYGGGARGALIFYGIKNPPQAFFKPTKTTPYVWQSYIAAALGTTPAAAVAAQKPSGGKPSGKTPSGTSSGPGASTQGGTTRGGQTQADPFDVPDQTQDFTPGAGAGTGATAGGSGTSQGAASSDAEPGAGAGAGESGSGAGVAIAVGVGLLGAAWLYSNRKKRRAAHATH
jgi:hypothetical protein